MDLPTLLDTQGLPQGMEARQRRLEGVHLLPGDFIPTADSLVRLVNSSTGVCKDGLARIWLLEPQLRSIESSFLVSLCWLDSGLQQQFVKCRV